MPAVAPMLRGDDPAISERGGGLVSAIDVQEAFRRGDQRRAATTHEPAPALAEEGGPFAGGVNEGALLVAAPAAGARATRGPPTRPAARCA